MRKRRGRWMALILCLVMLPGTALAATVNLTADALEVQTGDAVEVTLTVTGRGMALAEGVFTYDPALLRFEEGEGGASDGLFSLVSAQRSGADTLTARLRFTAAAAGTAQVQAIVERVLGYDGKEQEGAKASVSVTVTAAPAAPEPTPIPYAQEGVAARNAQGAEEALYIWRTLENVTLPSRYEETELNYHGETVAAAVVKDSDAPVLLYLSDASGERGGYYVYLQAEDRLTPYQTLSSASKTYILLEPDGSVALPEGFVQTTLAVDGEEYPAWSLKDAQGEVYLVYARNPDGETGYYVYSPADSSLQRYAVLPARPPEPALPEASPAPAEQELSPPAIEQAQAGTIALPVGGFYLLLAAIALLLAAVAGLLVLRLVEKKRRRSKAARHRAALRREQG